MFDFMQVYDHIIELYSTLLSGFIETYCVNRQTHRRQIYNISLKSVDFSKRIMYNINNNFKISVYYFARKYI